MKRISILLLTVIPLSWAVIGSQKGQLKVEKVGQPILATGAIQPRLSPDGTTIAFSLQGAIWTCPREGGTMTRLTDGEGFDWEPVWAPDGKRLALVRSPYQLGGELKFIQAADGKEIPLPGPVQVRGTVIYYKLEFHPDGRRILGVFRIDGKDHGLAWYDIQTGKVQTVTNLPTWSRYALSPDGKSIVYTGTMDVPGQQTGHNGPQADIWKIPAEGGKAEKIARFPSRIHDLCFDAKGASLIVVSELGGVHYDLWKVPLEDPLRGMRKLTQGQADEDRPTVSRDGRWLGYTDNRAGPTSLVLRDLASGEDRTLAFDRLDFRVPTGKLRLTTTDRDSKKPVNARISLKQEPGKYYAPVGALHRVLRGYGHFYCDQDAEMTVPAGKYKLRAYRGPEYKVAYQEFDIQPGKTLDLPIELARWTHAARDGWFSGENHIHANYGYGQWYNTPRTMFQQCSGEDLNVCNFMVANSDTDGVFDRAFFRGGPDPLSTSDTILYWNQEFRSTLWGHMTLLNLKQVVEPVFTGFKDTTNPWDIPTNSDVADRTHWQNGLVNYTHGVQNPDDPFVNPYAGKGIPVDVALGKIDTLDINNSYQGCVPVWHRLLNCGFKVHATAGTDCFLNRIYSQLPGGDRVYVKLKGPLHYADWIEGLKQGKSFVSNGPMLEFAVDKQGPGGIINTPKQKKVKVQARALSQHPLAKVELLYNGQVLTEANLTPDNLSAAIDQEILLDRSGWLAWRATGPGHPDSPKPLLYAHTNPIYVEVAGNPVRSRADALFFLNWLEKLSLEIRTRDRVPNDDLRRHIQSQVEAARMVYARIAKDGD